MDRRSFLIASGGLTTLAALRSLPASAAGREGTLLVLVGDGPNSMDIHRTGTNRPSYQIAVNLYDRLVTFGSKTLDDGSVMYDYEDIQPELAESWEISDDGSVMTFHLRPDATFWDGTPVTAADVKWSFDRAVSVGGFSGVQVGAGLLVDPDQFEAVDDHTFVSHMK
jgi:peptide/nickel transport system substrate-binding protein